MATPPLFTLLDIVNTLEPRKEKKGLKLKITETEKGYKIVVVGSDTLRKQEKAQQTLKDMRFWNAMIKEHGDDEQLIPKKQKAQKDTTERFQESIYRTQRTMIDILENNLNDTSFLVTLTYVGNFQDYDEAQKDFKAFCRKMKKQLGDDLLYMTTKEHQERGAIHFHMVVFQKVDDWLVGNAWRHGFFTVTHINDRTSIERLANYFTGYLTKMTETNPLVVNFKKLLFSSKNIKRSAQVKDLSTISHVVKLWRSQLHTIKPTKVYRSKYRGWVTEYYIAK